MFALKKTPGKDFILLNLSDPQLGDGEWAEGHPNRAILEGTVTELCRRVKPDLITVSGDLAWAGDDLAYDALADLLDSFGIPWTVMWGNHDNQGGADYIESVVKRYLTRPLCLYERGPANLGNGNFVIRIEENGRPVEGIIVMDSHDRAPYVNEKGEESMEWAKLWPEQIAWYREQIAALKEDGCRDAALLMHIPIYAYREAHAAAEKPGIDRKAITPAQADGDEVWNPGYESSFGVRHEGICSYPADEGMFGAILEGGLTKTLIAGHDHVNNTVIRHRGVAFVYSLKAGAGCYWEPSLNGGTVLRITENGVGEIRHEYVDPEAFRKG
jgi:hypothetical protein